MAYLPPVVARLSFDLGDLDAKIEEAKAKIRSLGDTIHIKTDINNGTLRQMAQDMEAIHRMMGRDQSIRDRVNLDDAEAKARLAELTRDRVTTVRVRVNKSDLSQAGGFLDAIKKLFTGGPDVNLPFTSMGASPMGLAAIAGGITALLPELAGLVSGFSAAGTAAGAFYVLAHPAIKNLQADVQGLSAANQKLHIAQNAYQLDPSKVNLRALTKAQDEYNATLKAAGQDAGPAAAGIMRLRSEYLKITTAFKPEVFKVLGSGVKLIADILPKAVPFANTFADSMTKWLTNLDKTSKGPAFQNFLKQFQSISGPALQAITAGIGNVAGSIGRLLTVMSGKDVAHAINIAFSAISGTIGGLTSTIRFLMNTWDGMKLAAHNVASAFDTVRHSIAGVGHDIAHDFDVIRHTIASFSPSAIISKFAGLGREIAHKIASGFDTVRHDIAAKFDGVKAAVMSKFSGAGAWLSSVAHNIASAFDHVRHDIAAWFDGVKGAIVSKFSGAIGWLVSTGANVIQGLINGLMSKIPGLSGVVNTVVGLLKSVGHAVGVKSPSTLFDYYGRMIGLGLAQGVESQYGRVQQAATGLTGMVTGSAAYAAGHGPAFAAADQPIHVHVHLDGREITNAVAQRAVQTQRRTGSNQMTRRTR